MPDNSQADPPFRRWFLLGLLGGLTAGFIRNPGGCGCLLLVALLIAGVAIWAWWPWSLLVILLIGVPFYIPVWIRWFRGQ